MRERFVAVEAKNEPGALGQVAGIVADAGVNIRAFAADASGLRLLPDDADKAIAALKHAGVTARAVEAVAIRIEDRPGELARVGQKLGNAGVDIVSAFGSAAGGGTVYLRPDDLARAEKLVARIVETRV